MQRYAGEGRRVSRVAGRKKERLFMGEESDNQIEQRRDSSKACLQGRDLSIVSGVVMAVVVWMTLHNLAGRLWRRWNPIIAAATVTGGSN